MTVYYSQAVDDPNYNLVTRLAQAAATTPIAYWRMHNNGNDEQGNHNGVVVGSPTFNEPGAIRQDSNTSAYFDGLTDYIEVSHNSALANASALSVFVWIRTTIGGWVVAKYDHTLSKRQWSISVDGSGFIVNISSDGTLTNTTGKTYSFSSTGILDDNWHFIGFTWNAGTLILYVDGVAVTPTKNRDGIFTTINQTDAPLRIGSGSADGAIFSPFNGYIDEVAIYDYALSAEQVANLNALGAATIKTIKPDGTGDYTTLAAWSVAAGALTEASKDVWWAECYSGNLGALGLTAGSHIATLGRRPRIYAASGHEATSSLTPNGAYISVSGLNTDCIWMDGLFWWNTTCWYSGIQISGLYLLASNSSSANGAYCIDSNGGKKDIVVERCVLVLGGTPTYTSAHISTWGIREQNTYRNNVFIFNQTAGSTVAAAAIICYGTSTTIHSILNNTFIVANGAQPPTSIIDNDYSSSVVAKCINNIAVGATTCFVSLNSTGSSNNISSDATAPGANSQHNIAATDLFVDYTNGDFRLKSGSPAIDAGIDLSSQFYTDILRTTRTTFDIGAFEYVIDNGNNNGADPPTFYRRMFGGINSRRLLM